MASIFGAVLSLRTATQAAATNGKITTGMINKLSDANTAQQLPTSLLPAMRTMLFNSLHTIMLISLGLVIISFILNLVRKAPVKQPR